MENMKNIYIYNSESKEVSKKIEGLRYIGREYGYEQVMNPKEANIIASIGGDGAFLQAIRNTGFREDCLYVGVNDNHLGFYTDFYLNDIDSIKSGFEANLLEVQKYPVLDVTVDGTQHFKCINECSIRSNIIKTLAIEVYIDDIHFETFRGDGLVVSTPTGSTAYNKSLRGAVVEPSLRAMQLTEISSLNSNEYRTLGSPLIVSEERELILEIIQDGNDHPIIGADNEALSIQHTHEIRVKMSNTQIKTLKLKDNSFFHKVKRSFL